MTKKPREKFDANRREIFLNFLRKGIRRTQACKKTGICRATFNKYMNTYPKFAEEVNQAEVDANELIEQSLFNSALKGNVTAQQVWLYNRDPERWQDRRNVTVGGDKENPIAIEGKIEISIDDILTEYYGSENSSGENNPSDDISESLHPTQADPEAVRIPDQSKA